MRLCFSYQLLAASCLLTVAQKIWTEDDEAQRIAMIKEMERKAFDDEVRSQQIMRRQQISSENRKQIQYPARQEESSPPIQQSEIVDESESNWCYQCTSPTGRLSDAMKKTIKDFLRLRRTSYPMNISTPECLNARDFSLLHKQKCRHRYCQTMSLVNHEEGTSFVLRGCAENFGAIDTKQLENQRENACTKLHDRVDISECICKERRYCYANERRSSFFFSPLLSILIVFILTS